MGVFGEGLDLRGGEGWGLRGKLALGFAESFVELFLAEGVDDFGGWVDASFEELLFDFLDVWFGWGRVGKVLRSN